MPRLDSSSHSILKLDLAPAHNPPLKDSFPVTIRLGIITARLSVQSGLRMLGGFFCCIVHTLEGVARRTRDNHAGWAGGIGETSDFSPNEFLEKIVQALTVGNSARCCRRSRGFDLFAFMTDV